MQIHGGGYITIIQDVDWERSSLQGQSNMKKKFSEYLRRKVLGLLEKKSSFVIVSGCEEESGGFWGVRVLLLISARVRENID